MITHNYRVFNKTFIITVSVSVIYGTISALCVVTVVTIMGVVSGGLYIRFKQKVKLKVQMEENQAYWEINRNKMTVIGINNIKPSPSYGVALLTISNCL